MDQLCQAYHWSYQAAIKMTVPQIHLLNHAAGVNSQRMDARIKAMNSKEELSDDIDAGEMWRGKPIDKLNSEELQAYYASGWQ